MRVSKSVSFMDYDKFIKFILKLKEDESVINASFNGSFDERRNGSVNVSWVVDEEI